MTGTVHRTRNGICSLIAPCPNLFLRFRADRREASARKRTEGKAPVPEYAEGRYDPRNGKPAIRSTRHKVPSRNEAVRRFSRTGGMLSDRHGANLLKIYIILEDFYNLLRHRRFGRKTKNEVMTWQPYRFLRIAVSCFHCHSS